MMVTQSDLALIAKLEEKIAHEAQARAGYTELFSLLKSSEDAKLISEIIADELHHDKVLHGLVHKYSGIEAPTV